MTPYQSSDDPAMYTSMDFEAMSAASRPKIVVRSVVDVRPNVPPTPPLVSFKKQAKERRAAEKAAKREARNKEMFNRWPKGLE